VSEVAAEKLCCVGWSIIKVVDGQTSKVEVVAKFSNGQHLVAEGSDTPRGVIAVAEKLLGLDLSTMSVLYKPRGSQPRARATLPGGKRVYANGDDDVVAMFAAIIAAVRGEAT